MTRDAVLGILQGHKQELAERYGVTRLGIFGSVARERMNAFLKQRIDEEAVYV